MHKSYVSFLAYSPSLFLLHTDTSWVVYVHFDEALEMTTDGKNLVIVPGASLPVPQNLDSELTQALRYLRDTPTSLASLTDRIDVGKALAITKSPLQDITTEKLVDNLENYLGLHSVQQILRSLSLISARSWSELKAVVKSGIQQKPELKEKLIDALVMQQACDLKAVSYHVVPASFVKLVELAISSVRVPDSEIAVAYPLRINEEQLKQDNGELKPVRVFQDEYGCGIVLSRKRVFTISQDIGSENFNSALKEQFPDADKIVAVKSVARQTFDTLYFNREAGLLEMRADIMRDATVVQTSKQMDKSNTDLKIYSSRLLSGMVSGLLLDAPINMFPLTTKVYADKSGAIKRLGFVTDTDSVKRETMKAGVDLRDELFHKSGASAIDHKMSIFEVAIQWHGDEVVGGVKGSKPEIHIPGTYRDYVNLNPRTDYIVVKGVRTFADANFIVSKINSYRT